MLEGIIRKAIQEKNLSKNEICTLLSIEEEGELDLLYKYARSIRHEFWGDHVFLYGFVYFSTWCRNDCNFCYYRKSNIIERYRKEPDEIIEISNNLKDSGVHLLDLTMGEDVKYHKENFSSILKIIRDIKSITGLPVMISPGVVSNDIIDSFADVGVDWYALYQETHNRELFRNLRINQDYDERMNAKHYARNKGMNIEEGLMTGIGETLEDLADSLVTMGRIGARQLRVMSFIPQKGIPMEHKGTPKRSLEMKIIAIMRLLYPWALIPASLDVDGIEGLKDRINAGANVVTSIIPPMSGLAGVAQNTMDIDDGFRTVKGVTFILEELGLFPGTVEEYKKVLDKVPGTEQKHNM